jgi:hypothetical protein
MAAGIFQEHRRKMTKAPKDSTPPETLSDSKPAKPPKPVAKAKIELLTHMVFEGESKSPGDLVEIPEADLDNWTKSGIAKLPE